MLLLIVHASWIWKIMSREKTFDNDGANNDAVNEHCIANVWYIVIQQPHLLHSKCPQQWQGKVVRGEIANVEKPTIKAMANQLVATSSSICSNQRLKKSQVNQMNQPAAGSDETGSDKMIYLPVWASTLQGWCNHMHVGHGDGHCCHDGEDTQYFSIEIFIVKYHLSNLTVFCFQKHDVVIKV